MILKRKEEVNTKKGRIGILLNILRVNDPNKKGRGKYKGRIGILLNILGVNDPKKKGRGKYKETKVNNRTLNTGRVQF